MLPRTDLIVSYKPLPHVARSAIIEKNQFVPGNRRKLLYVGNWKPLPAGGRKREPLEEILRRHCITRNCKKSGS